MGQCAYDLPPFSGGRNRSAPSSARKCETPGGIFLIEFKLDQSADEALAQIERNRYAEKYDFSGKRVFRVGISFSSEKRTIVDVKTAIA